MIIITRITLIRFVQPIHNIRQESIDDIFDTIEGFFPSEPIPKELVRELVCCVRDALMEQALLSLAPSFQNLPREIEASIASFFDIEGFCTAACISSHWKWLLDGYFSGCYSWPRKVGGREGGRGLKKFQQLDIVKSIREAQSQRGIVNAPCTWSTLHEIRYKGVSYISDALFQKVFQERKCQWQAAIPNGSGEIICTRY
jgi:hypothetical protein